MTYLEMTNSPTGTTFFFVEENRDRPPHMDDLTWRATHWEKVYRGVRSRVFYSCDRDAALAKAERYDTTRRELRESWKAKVKSQKAKA